MYFAIYLVVVVASGLIGQRKGFPIAGWVLGFLLGPIGLLVIALSKKDDAETMKAKAGKINRARAAIGEQQESAKFAAGLSKCKCGESYPATDAVCPFCGAGRAG